MRDEWGEDYVRLGLRLEKAIPGFVDGYFGPAALKTAVDREGPPAPADLVRAAMRLADALPAQSYDAMRAAYLARQVRAMETIGRQLAGERFDLADEVERCFDIHVERTPEAVFEEALAIYDATVPGSGSLAERVEARRRSQELPRDRTPLVLGLLTDAMAEVRRRTAAFVEMPVGENVELATVTNQPWGAYNWYLGEARSRIELNTDLPTNLAALLDTAAHEGYPGHHTEHALKEARLYREQGHLENSILLINTPECVIAEGIATMAAEMIFAPGEARAWTEAHIFPAAGLASDTVDAEALRQAGEMLAGVRGNAVFMLHVDGRSDDDVAAYLMRYSLLNEARARKALEFLKSPLWRAYTFTYAYGKRLMQPLLQGPDRLAVFSRLLTEPVYPGLLVEWGEALTPS